MQIDDPIALFGEWFLSAQAAGLHQPHAMTLATATPDGRPSARMVLLKGHDQRGFLWFSNYESRKGIELQANPHAALILFWSKMHRQIRVEGAVETVSAEESDAYFATRPQGSRIAAAASAQSRPIDSRQVLEDRVAELTEEWQETPIPRPAYWGGFRLVPQTIEFWQGRENRLHERLVYHRNADGTWRTEILAP